MAYLHFPEVGTVDHVTKLGGELVPQDAIGTVFTWVAQNVVKCYDAGTNSAKKVFSNLGIQVIIDMMVVTRHDPITMLVQYTWIVGVG